jgi:lipopolysaccharide biosynthesis glycosyltransferase
MTRRASSPTLDGDVELKATQPILMRTIALFADRWILPGLHVTLASLLDHAVDSQPFRIVVFGEGLGRRDKALLDRTVERRLGRHRLEVRDFVTPETHTLKSLRGNYTAYGRLFLPDLLPDTDACLYLDCDLIITCSVDPLLERGASDTLLHADGTGRRGDSIDNRAFERLGLDMSKPYFNSGVLVLNLEQWRTQRIGDQCLNFARQHRDLLRSADQMVLNALLGDRFEAFGEDFNTAVWPSSPEISRAKRTGHIFHLVGAPKPWDYFGRFAHRNFGFWFEWIRKTAWFADAPSRITSGLGVRQRMRIMPATLRELRARYL